ncbi:MAG: sulfite exporter TauE/SafE family protein [Zhongshania sp.]|uniref:sulfite exporter TauE/SafE family protein n=1 Tax=Zhongshania sp. TaxID=1971902 RepID=UPI00260A809E|nr:sulfite exporter TauE/SafE family protein [Zhongshania sp.]MDF1691857.1 sulfite exporter TauE/SafE family protein [Zhongshania sp.]
MADMSVFSGLNPWFVVLLLVVGVVAGIINTLAGGGSNLTLPALMVMGLPADVANATNRVGVLMQSLSGVRDFDRHGQLARDDIWGVLRPVLLGSVFGAVAAAFAPAEFLKPALLLAMVTMALIILVMPSVVAPPLGTPTKRVADSQQAVWGLFFAGIYGGFVQAGVGFVLITALAGGLRYDLVKTNALKMLCTAALTIAALAVFIWQGLVAWLLGIILACGSVVGAKIGVRLALKTSQRGLKWFLFIMTVVASVFALFKE